MKRKIHAFSLLILLALPLCLFVGCQSYDKVEEANRPGAGDAIAIVTLQGLGEVKIRLLPDEETAEITKNFTKAAETGLYDGSLLAKPTGEDAFVQSGELSGFSLRLLSDHMTHRHTTGAVSMTAGGTGQFIIVDAPKPISYVELADYVQRAEQNGQGETEYSQTDVRSYGEYGGAPQLDRVNWVFGYVYEGMNVVSGAMKQGATIESIEVTTAS